MDAVPVVAVIKAKPGQEQALEEALKGLLVPTHQEPGCLRYALHRSTSDPTVFVFMEKWATEDDFKRHLDSPHVKEAFARQDVMIEGMQVVPLNPILGGDLLRGAL